MATCGSVPLCVASCHCSHRHHPLSFLLVPKSQLEIVSSPRRGFIMKSLKIKLQGPKSAWADSKNPATRPTECCEFKEFLNVQFSLVQSLTRVRLFVTPWIAAHQASLSITNHLSLLKFMSIESVMPSSHLILCCPLLCLQCFPASESFPMSRLFASGGQSVRASALASVQFSCSLVSDSLWPHESQHTRPACPSPTPRVHSDPCPSSQWCHPAISSSVVPFSSCPQSLPASESLPMSQLFTWGGQSTGVSA